MAQWVFYAPSNSYQFRITATQNKGSAAQNSSTISWIIEQYNHSVKYSGTMERYFDIGVHRVYGYHNNNYDSTWIAYYSWGTVAWGTSPAIAHNADGSCPAQALHFVWKGTSGGYGPGNIDEWVTLPMESIARQATYLYDTPYAEAILYDRFNMAVYPSRTCDYLVYKLDGSAWQTGFVGDFSGWKVLTLGGSLRAGTTHTFQASIRAKDSQLWNESPVRTMTTANHTVSSSVTDITINSARINCSANDNYKQWRWRLNGGSWSYSAEGNWTSTSQVVTGLSSGMRYTLQPGAKGFWSNVWVDGPVRTFDTPLHTVSGSVTETDDVSIKVGYEHNDSVDWAQYRLDDGSWVDLPVSGVNINRIIGLRSNTQYKIRIRLRATVSQKWAESADFYGTTLRQDHFMPIMEEITYDQD